MEGIWHWRAQRSDLGIGGGSPRHPLVRKLADRRHHLLCAALAGVTIPLVLRELDIDPALAGGVILTTVTDVVGFFAFLGLATLILL